MSKHVIIANTALKIQRQNSLLMCTLTVYIGKDESLQTNQLWLIVFECFSKLICFKLCIHWCSGCVVHEWDMAQ